MKKYILFIPVIFISIASKAQDFKEYNYAIYSIGGGFSYVRGYTNINSQDSHLAANINFSYNYNPYIPVTLELQAGRLSGGGVLIDPYGRAYINNYVALIAHTDFQLGQFINYRGNGFLNVIKNFYAGSGIGFVNNDDKVQRISPYDPGYIFPGKDHSINFMVPLRFGYEFKFYDSFDLPSFKIAVSYEHNLVFGEGLDGYNDPSSKFRNNNIDQYRQISVGIKYDFGPRTSFIKLQ